MAGVTLSRWTMSYFAIALVALIGAQSLMAAGYGYPAAGIRAPETLVLVHVVALGWLSLLMCGALFQFVPVIVARPLYSDALPLPALACLTGGIAALIGGFAGLAGGGVAGPWLFPAAAVLLATGFALVLWNVGRTLWSARPLPLPARFVVAGLCSLAATATLGAIFALVLGGATAQPRMTDLAASGIPIHAAAGLGGWLTFTAMGVSYRLLAMFMLAPEAQGRRPRAVLYLGAGALTAAVVGGVAAICAGHGPEPALAAGGVLGLAALILYGQDIVHLYRARRRRVLELNSRMARLALGSLAATLALMAVLLGLGALGRHVGAVLFLLSFGWLTGLGLAKLYKIVAFLTWLECFGPVLGKMQTPRVQDLVVERRAAKWFLLYFAAVWAATALLLFDLSRPFQAAAGLMAVATAGIVAELVRTRRLADVKALPPAPGRGWRPRLFYALPRTA